jgi:hypothetical protein
MLLCRKRSEIVSYWRKNEVIRLENEVVVFGNVQE